MVVSASQLERCAVLSRRFPCKLMLPIPAFPTNVKYAVLKIKTVAAAIFAKNPSPYLRNGYTSQPYYSFVASAEGCTSDSCVVRKFGYFHHSRKMRVLPYGIFRNCGVGKIMPRHVVNRRRTATCTERLPLCITLARTQRVARVCLLIFVSSCSHSIASMCGQHADVVKVYRAYYFVATNRQHRRVSALLELYSSSCLFLGRPTQLQRFYRLPFSLYWFYILTLYVGLD